MPVTMGIVAGGQALLGAGQAIFSGKNKQQARLEQMANNSPMQTGNKAINDYYEQQMARANANPYQSASYLNTMKGIQNTTASGLGALQGRGAAIGGVGKIVAMADSGAGQAVGQAINQSNQANASYGHSVGMKAGDDKAVWQNNVLDPYTRKLQLQQMKTKAANDTFNNGLNMIGSAAANYSAYQSAAAGGSGYNPSRQRVGGSTVNNPGYGDYLPDGGNFNPNGDQSVPNGN